MTGKGKRLRMILETIPQSAIDHIIIVELAKAGVFGAVEKHVTRSNFPVVTNLIFCEDFTG